MLLSRPKATAAVLSTFLSTVVAAAPLQTSAPQGAPATAGKAAPAPAKAKAPSAPESVDGGWPRVVNTSVGTLTIYQPQLDSWDGIRLEFLAAVSMTEKGTQNPIYGVVWGNARTQTDGDTRLVTFSDRQFKKAAFPSAPDKQAAWLEVIRKEVAPQVTQLALDRFTAALEMADLDRETKAVVLKNDPPRMVFQTTPSILVYVDGAPSYQPVKDSKLQRVINTRVLLLRDEKGVHYLRVFDGWMKAPSLDGAWEVETKPSKDFDKVLADAKASGQVDFLIGGNPNDAKTLPSLKQQGRRPPTIVVATAPTELIVTEGAPEWVPIEGTQLQYVKNTTGNLLKCLGDQKTYVLVSGRWFRSASLDGPWEYVAGDRLPADFAKIPDDSPKENVKAAVAGTPQAKEALIANAIPQTAAVKVSEAKIDPPRYDGEPKLAPIEGTSMHYVVNSATPIIQVSAASYYAVQDGVWFTSTTTGGPWTVATTVPSAIYTIPPSSALHYVTYVRIYDSTPDTVYEGYTPGYYGSCVSNGTVVYGTGYYYPPYVGTTVWYGPPVTYGGGVAITYTPGTGWTYGFGFGWSWGAATVGWGWGAYPWWGPVGWGYYYPYPYYRPAYWGGAAWGPWGGGAVWGPGGWAATSGNVYSRWGSTSAVTQRSGGYNAWTGNAWRNSAGMSYNSRTGNLAAGQRSAVGNVYSGNYAYGSRGTVTNSRTGQTVSGGRVTGGNIYNGTQGSAGYVRGEQGGVARVGDDVYAGKDGNVYKRGEGGGWQERQGDGSWGGVQDPARTRDLDQQNRARSTGEARVNGYDHSRTSGYGGGYRSGGGGSYGGGGMRGGGGRRR
jgi:hypothetical protein